MPDPNAITIASAAVAEIIAALRTCPAEQAVITSAPPGAGKSTLVVQTATVLVQDDDVAQVPVVVQTNNQADDLAIALARAGLITGRFTASGYTVPPTVLGVPGVRVDADLRRLRGCQVIVATGHKWTYLDRGVTAGPWEVSLIDEAYQMRSDLLLRLSDLFRRTLAIGDPGQLDPFSIVDTERWAGQPFSPLSTAAATLLLAHPQVPRQLPVSFRLPPSAAALVAEAFYAQAFQPGTLPGERRMTVDRVDIGTAADRAVTVAAATGWAFVELPTRFTAQVDQEAITTLVDVARRLLQRDATTFCERFPAGVRLGANRIAIGVVHRDQRQRVRLELQAQATEHGLPALAQVTVDTANAIQGREFDVVVVLHPLSGRRDATEFHLESGRLCVLLSRHRHACIVVGRAGIAQVLEAHPTSSPIYPDLPVQFPDGWVANHTVLEHLQQHRV